MKDWEECVKEKIVYKVLPDIDRISKMGKISKIRFEFWNKDFNQNMIS